jgi:TonB family protein
MSEPSSSSQRKEVDWNDMSDPIPLDLIDPEFAPPGNYLGMERMPGSSSEILPRETAESLMAPPVTDEARSAEGTPEDASQNSRSQSQSDTDIDFSGLRAQLEAETAAEDEARAKAEEEEAAQRERLEQWMANARARLQAADEDPAVPGAPVRIKREPSPTMIRMAEMQKTMFDAGAAEAETLAEGTPRPTGSFRFPGMGGGPVDPMATIIVHKDAFVEAPKAASATPSPAVVSPAAAVSSGSGISASSAIGASSASSKPANDDPRTAKLKAVERKVAQIRLAEAGAETMIMAPVTQPQSMNVRVAIWVLGGLIPIILGLGLYALTQAGYLDGLEDVFPALTGNASAKHAAAPKPMGSVAESPRAEAARMEMAKAEKARAQVPVNMPVTPAPADVSPQAPIPVPVPAPPPAPRAVNAPVTSRMAAANAESPRKAKSQPMARKPRPVAAPAAAAPMEPATPDQPSAASAAATALENARRNAETSMAGVQIAKPTLRGDAPNSGRGEAELKSSIQVALNADAEAVQAIYDRFAMGMPGLTGDVVIGITVNPSGHIVEGSVAATTTGAASFDQELLRKVLGWRLGPFSDNRPRYVAVPFHFDSKEP